ncbi:MAG TPA: hypothetical protein DEA08_16535 [Planctomycetes bacterium]|nr:hypothetical protein [Planctomycetota bacterium]
MSWTPINEAQCPDSSDSERVRVVVEPRPRDLGGLVVGRVLPAAACRTVGPFVFFDQMGPTRFEPGEGLDVPPHPHIHLATVTYLLEGELVHRDSLGVEQRIRPGELNFMFAGRGVAHSERTDPGERAAGPVLHGLQLWLGVPSDQEDQDPWFEHRSADELPAFDLPRGGRVRLLLGAGWGHESPARTLSPTFYADVMLAPGDELSLPAARELAAFVIEGAPSIGSCQLRTRQLAVFGERRDQPLRATDPTRLVLLGGDPLDGRRFMWWNFASSRREAIDAAKQEWRERRFPLVPGDEDEFVPLPE